MIGTPAQSWGQAGTHRTPASAALKRSYVKHQVDFPPDTPVFQMVPALLQHLGGATHLINTIARVKPEHIDLDLVLPVKDSPEQEGGFISPESISNIQQLGASLSFSFLNRAAKA